MAVEEDQEKPKSNHSRNHHPHDHHRRSLSFNFHVPQIGYEKDKAAEAAKMPPKGWMTVRVGQEREERRRFVVPVVYLNHPLFAELLLEAEKEYGFKQEGAIIIPCEVQHFLQVQDSIGRAATHHQQQHHKLHHLPHLPCFGA